MAASFPIVISYTSIFISYYLFYWLYFISVNVDLYVPQIYKGNYNVKGERKYSFFEPCDNDPCIVNPAVVQTSISSPNMASSPIKISLPIEADIDPKSKRYECRSLNGCLRSDIKKNLNICREKGLTEQNTNFLTKDLNLLNDCVGNKNAFINAPIQGLPGTYDDLPENLKALEFLKGSFMWIITIIVALVLGIGGVAGVISFDWNDDDDNLAALGGILVLIGVILCLIWMYEMNGYNRKLAELKSSYVRPELPFLSQKSGWGEGSKVTKEPITLGSLFPDAISGTPDGEQSNSIKIWERANKSVEEGGSDSSSDWTAGMNITFFVAFILISIVFLIGLCLIPFK